MTQSRKNQKCTQNSGYIWSGEIRLLLRSKNWLLYGALRTEHAKKLYCDRIIRLRVVTQINLRNIVLRKRRDKIIELNVYTLENCNSKTICDIDETVMYGIF